MKKLLILGIALATSLCFISTSFAVPVNKTIIDETRLDADPTSITSSTFNIQDYKKIAFFVDYDETQVGGVSVAFTIDVSYDGTNWIDASFYDYAGGATLQTSETLTSDGWYYAWFNPDLTVPYVRAVVTCTGCDADDLVDVSAYMSGVK